MIKHLSIATVVCLSSILIGCSSYKEANQVTIELEGNITTGYSWEYEITTDGIVVEVYRDYIEGNTDEYAVGSGGMFTFTFSGVNPGETEIVFKYLRLWEKDIQPERIAIYEAVVDSNNRIRITQK